MAARSSSSEEDAEDDARSTDEEDRLPTKPRSERQWEITSLEQNTCLRVKKTPVCSQFRRSIPRIREENKNRLNHSIFNSLPGRWAHRTGSKRPRSKTVTSCSPETHTCLTPVYAALVPLGFACLNNRKRDDTKLSKKKKNTALPWSCGHVLPCCCLRFRKPATAPSLCTSTRAVAQP